MLLLVVPVPPHTDERGRGEGLGVFLPRGRLGVARLEEGDKLLKPALRLGRQGRDFAGEVDGVHDNAPGCLSLPSTGQENRKQPLGNAPRLLHLRAGPERGVRGLGVGVFLGVAQGVLIGQGVHALQVGL